MTKRSTPAARKADILTAALDLSRAGHYQRISREAIAERAGCSVGLVSRYLGTMPQLRRAVISAAIAKGDVRVLAQGLAAGEAKALAAPQELRVKAAEWLAS